MIEHPIVMAFVLAFVGYFAEYVIHELQERGILPKRKMPVPGPPFPFPVRIVEQGAPGDRHGRGAARRTGDKGRKPETIWVARVPHENDIVPFDGKTARVVGVELLANDAVDPWCAIITVERAE